MTDYKNCYNKMFFDILVLADTDIENKTHIQYLDNNDSYINLNNVFDEKYFCDYYDYTIANELSWSLYSFGWMYQTGMGVKQDYKKAIKLYEISIKKNNHYAMNNLARMYQYSNGLEFDHNRIIELYEMGAKSGNCHAITNLKYLYKSDDGESQNFEICNIGTKKYHEIAINNLAGMCLNGTYAKKNVTKAFELYEINAKKDNMTAINCLARMYLRGEDTKQDIEKAFELYESNAKRGNDTAIKALNDIYLCNLNDKDYKLDFKLCLFGINKGHKKALTKLAFMYINGHGFEKDYLVGCDMLYLANDDRNIQYMLNNHYDTLKQLYKNRKAYIQCALWTDLNEDICNIISTYVNAF